MIFLRQYIEQYKKLITSWLLALFLLSNYGVNFIGHDHEKHEHFIIKTTEKGKSISCVLCNFQSLLYEPLSQKYFEFEQVFQEIHKLIKSFYRGFYLLEYSFSIFQRGPPFLFI